MPEIDSAYDRLGQLATRRSRMLTVLQLLVETIMATEQDERNALADLKQAVADKVANDQKVVDALEALIATAQAQNKALTEQLAQVGQAPAADFEDLVSQITNIKALLVPVTGADVAQPTTSTNSTTTGQTTDQPGETQVPVSGS